MATASKIDELKGSITGSILVPGDGEYDNARKIWNGMIDRHPAMIVGRVLRRSPFVWLE